MRYISDLKIDETVVEHYLCKKKQTLKFKINKICVKSSYFPLIHQKMK